MCALVPHVGCLHLLWQGGEYVLLHQSTGEALPVGAAYQSVSLHFNADGWGFVSTDGVVKWCSEMLRFHVVQKDGRLFVADKHQENPLEHLVAVRAFFGESRLAQMELQLGSFGAGNTFLLGTLLLPMYMSRLWWSLQSIWRAFGASKVMKQKFKSWRGNRWPAWRSYLTGLGLPAAVLMGAANSRQDSAPDGDGLEFFSFAACSTVALLCLCCRWAGSSPRHGRWEVCAAQSLELVSRLVAHAGDCELVLPFRVRLSAGSSTAACEAQAALRVRGGMLENARELCDTVKACSIASQFRRAVAEVVEADSAKQCSLAAFLVAVAEGAGDASLFLGLMVQVAFHVEGGLCGKQADASAKKKWWESPCALDFRVDGLALSYQARQSFLRAYAAECQPFLRDVCRLSVVLDDSRVGRKSIKLLAAVLPRSVAFWLAPQVDILIEVWSVAF